jgi:hypothetical protein
MNWNGRASLKLLAAIFFVSALLTACDKDKDDVKPPNKPDLLFYALTDNNQLMQFNAKNAGTALKSVSVTGLQSGERLLSIDFRPATGQLYGLGSTSRLYIINQMTGSARAVGTAAFTPAISGEIATIDFNPTVDRIRLITNTGQNLRLNPETGSVAATDGVINGTKASSVIEAAYTNSMAGAATTVLFDIDATTDKLYKQDPPNDGKLVEVGDLKIDISGTSGFDITTDNKALAAFAVNGSTALYEVNLDNGSTIRYDAFPSGLKITGLAIQTPAVAYAIDVDNNLLIFNPANAAQQPISKAVTGVQAGEKIVGIDMRPLNGQLYGLGSTGRLYTLNLSSGAVAALGATPLVITGTDFGFDFNPTVDRIRIVSNTGLNLRANPNDGALTAPDLPLNPGAPSVTAAAYTNNFAGAATTTLFDIDTNTDRLLRQDPPNNGLLVDIGPLGINATSLNGFDIGGTSGTAYAILTVGTSSAIYTINLQSGAATKTADFPKAVQAMAVGLGF